MGYLYHRNYCRNGEAMIGPDDQVHAIGADHWPYTLFPPDVGKTHSYGYNHCAFGTCYPGLSSFRMHAVHEVKRPARTYWMADNSDQPGRPGAYL